MSSLQVESESTALKRDSLGLPSVLAVSLSFISPTIGAIFVTALIVGQAGASAPFVFGMGAVALTLNAVTFAQFARRVPSSGILYSSVAKGIGPSTGLVQGLVLLVVYGVVSIANICLFGGFVADVLTRRATIDVPWWILSVGVIVAIGILAWLSVSASMRFDLVLLAFEVVVVGALFIVIVVQGGADGQIPGAVGPSLSPSGFSGLGLGFVYVALAYFGFESCTTVAEEARDTRRSIPFALIGSVVLSGIFFVFASYAILVGFGSAHLDALTDSAAPVSDLAGRYIGDWYEVFIDIAAVSAITAVLLSMQNGNFRIWHSLAREQVLPRFLAKVHPEHKTPTAAIIGFSIVSAIGALIAGSTWGPLESWGYLGYFCGLGILPIYLLPQHRPDSLHVDQAPQRVQLADPRRLPGAVVADHGDGAGLHHLPPTGWSRPGDALHPAGRHARSHRLGDGAAQNRCRTDRSSRCEPVRRRRHGARGPQPDRGSLMNGQGRLSGRVGVLTGTATGIGRAGACASPVRALLWSASTATPTRASALST